MPSGFGKPAASRRISSRNLHLVVLGVAIFGFLFTDLVPVYWIALSAFTPRGELFADKFRYLPLHVSIENFRLVFESIPYGRYFLNSLIVCFSSTLIVSIVSFLASYPFARLRFRGRDFVFMLFLASMMLPPMSTVIPLFKLFRDFGLLNTLGGLILVYSSALLPFTIWIFTSFFRQVPAELEDAARIDGAGFGHILLQIVAPLMRPILSSMFIINFISAWNELVWPLIFCTRTDAKLLTVGLTEAATTQSFYTPWENISAMAVMMIVPVTVLVLVFQRQIMAGLMSGAFKE
ncbi:MAG: carbohydrate ABC transporter permease [Firmicutes bacterium]|nr:carbohydrate ABC transporter permease [Bacillota bacterium]